MYFLRLALRPWRLALGHQILASTSVGFLLFLMGILFWLHQGLSPVLHHLSQNQKIIIYLKEGLAPLEEKVVFDQMTHLLRKVRGFKMHRMNVMEILARSFKKDTTFFSELEKFQSLPVAIALEGVFSEAIFNEIQGVPHVETVKRVKYSSQGDHQSLIHVFLILKKLIRILMVGIGLCLCIGFMHLVRLNHYFYEDTWKLLRLWGAQETILIWSNILSGVLVGFLGGVLAWVSWILVREWFVGRLRILMDSFQLFPSFPSQLGIILFMLGGLLGLVAGMVESQRVRLRERV